MLPFGAPNWLSAQILREFMWLNRRVRSLTTGEFENDPNVTDKKFPGNPTLSFRSRAPLRVIAEVTGWEGHSPEQLGAMREGIARLISEGKHQIIDE